MHHHHERVIPTTPEQLAGLLSDFDAIWPTQIAPAPRPLGDRRYQASPMIWEEFERAGAIRAFRVILPEKLQAQHWFEVQAVDGGRWFDTRSTARRSVSTRRSGATESSPVTTASSKPFSTTSRRPWPELESTARMMVEAPVLPV